MVPPDPEVLIAVMPSHDPAQSPDQGIRAVARNLVGYGYGDAVDFLVRTTRIPKKADGGVRDLEVEVNSLRLDHARRVRGAAIVLLDDVTTKGTSFSAGRHLLTAAGAEQVICVAIGKTFREVG
jgi:predicted amidophosphoribosyltransferase